MNSRRTRNNNYYLDLTQFILTEHRQFAVPSPNLTPLNIQQPDVLHIQTEVKEMVKILTPNNVPLIIEVEGVELSPYFHVGEGQDLDIQFYDFTLENISQEHDSNSEQNEEQSEQNQFESNYQNYSEQQNQEAENDENIPQYDQIIIPKISPTKLNIRYFKQIYSELRKSKATEAELKEFISDYLVDENYEEINFETALSQDLYKIAKRNLRLIGPISWLQRKHKVLKYVEKKKKRIWKKKISYDCRKRVADNRLRVKGKFVTKQQACNMLGVEQLEEQDIKQLLVDKKNVNKPR